MARAASPLAVAVALGTVYLVWGSTYLAIAWAVEDIPPLLMGGARWLLAGGILFAVTRARSRERLTWANWRAAGVVGALLILGGNGSVNVAEQWVPSALAALIIASVPFWIVLLDWLRGAPRPSFLTALGVGIGLAGVALLVGAGGLSSVDARGAALLVLATLSWAYGSLWSRNAPLPQDHLLGASMQMLVGGALMTVLGLGVGERPPEVASVSARAWGAFAFLVVFGSIVAYSAYVWLLQVAPATKVSTYAFVNPLVAVILGYTLNAEPITTGTIVAGALILAAVAVLLWQRARVAARASVPRADSS